MYVKEISEVKNDLDQLKANGLIKDWELPYEELLTRLSAAIFFITPANEEGGTQLAIWNELDKYNHFSFRPNYEKKLSGLQYRITFNEEEKQKNLQKSVEENHL